MKKTIGIVIIILIVVVIGWYAISSMQQSSDTTQTTQPSTNLGVNGGAGQSNTGQTNVPPVLKSSSDTKLGNFLVASNGMTLYKYTKDSNGTTTCYGACAVNWPPYIVSSNEPLMADNGISGALSTITRADGSVQLTYNGMPLYFWKNDKKAGDTTGQNVGGVWFVVKP
jgi:predicted lipoprotein with Yx(FWY)xxD motif